LLLQRADYVAAEAPLRRAEAAAIQGSSRSLAVALYFRGDITGAGAALRRGLDRGDEECRDLLNAL
jgi:hypothetical protein